jgi:hypothetical protein
VDVEGEAINRGEVERGEAELVEELMEAGVEVGWEEAEVFCWW